MKVKETILAIGIGLLFLSSVAHADHIRPWPDPSVIKVPPPQYDPRIKGIPPGAKLLEVPHAKLQATCNYYAKDPKRFGPGVLGCAFKRLRIAIIPSDAREKPGLYVALRRHEYGHLWGWTHD